MWLSGMGPVRTLIGVNTSYSAVTVPITSVSAPAPVPTTSTVAPITAAAAQWIASGPIKPQAAPAVPSVQVAQVDRTPLAIPASATPSTAQTATGYETTADALAKAIQAATGASGVAFAADGTPLIVEDSSAAASAADSTSLPPWIWLALAAGAFYLLRK